jgi:hypothetical protein
MAKLPSRTPSDWSWRSGRPTRPSTPPLYDCGTKPSKPTRSAAKIAVPSIASMLPAPHHWPPLTKARTILRPMTPRRPSSRLAQDRVVRVETRRRYGRTRHEGNGRQGSGRLEGGCRPRSDPRRTGVGKASRSGAQAVAITLGRHRYPPKTGQRGDTVNISRKPAAAN